MTETLSNILWLPLSLNCVRPKRGRLQHWSLQVTRGSTTAIQKEWRARVQFVERDGHWEQLAATPSLTPLLLCCLVSGLEDSPRLAKVSEAHLSLSLGLEMKEGRKDNRWAWTCPGPCARYSGTH